MIKGSLQFFDYANHEKVRTVVKIYFQNGFPVDPPLSGIFSELSDLKTIRNACAHLSSTTTTPLESLAIRIFGAPKPGISVYQLLTTRDPRSSAGDTVFIMYKNKRIPTRTTAFPGVFGL
jgi:hypothetical protein